MYLNIFRHLPLHLPPIFIPSLKATRPNCVSRVHPSCIRIILVLFHSTSLPYIISTRKPQSGHSTQLCFKGPPLLYQDNFSALPQYLPRIYHIYAPTPIRSLHSPVFPEVGSIRTSPGLMSPRASASSIILRPILSLTDPPALKNSHFTTG